MKVTYPGVSTSRAKATALLLVALFLAGVNDSARAQEKASDKAVRGRSASGAAKDARAGKGFFCRQTISDLTITQRRTGVYEFRFRTACATPVTIEFFKEPPVSLNPPRFKKPQYERDEPLVPVLTTGLIGDRTEHQLFANHAGHDRRWDYYLITVEDASGNRVYKTGSLSLDSVRSVHLNPQKVPGIRRN